MRGWAAAAIVVEVEEAAVSEPAEEQGVPGRAEQQQQQQQPQPRPAESTPELRHPCPDVLLHLNARTTLNIHRTR